MNTDLHGFLGLGKSVQTDIRLLFVLLDDYLMVAGKKEVSTLVNGAAGGGETDEVVQGGGVAHGAGVGNVGGGGAREDLAHGHFHFFAAQGVGDFGYGQDVVGSMSR